MLYKYFSYLPKDIEIDISNKLIHGKTNVVKRSNNFYILDFMKYMPEFWNMKYLCPNYYAVKNYLNKGLKKYIFIPFVSFEKPEEISNENILTFTGEDFKLYINGLANYDNNIKNYAYYEPQIFKKDRVYKTIYIINSMDNTFGYLTDLVVSNLNLADKLVIYDPFIDLFFPKKELDELSSIYNFKIENINDNIYAIEKEKNFIDLTNLMDYDRIFDVLLGDSSTEEYEEYLNKIIECNLNNFMNYLIDKFVN